MKDKAVGKDQGLLKDLEQRGLFSPAQVINGIGEDVQNLLKVRNHRKSFVDSSPKKSVMVHCNLHMNMGTHRRQIILSCQGSKSLTAQNIFV